MTWTVAAADILARAGVTSPTAEQTARATAAAAAVNSAYTTRLNGYTVAAASDAEAELTRAAQLDGLAAYRDFDAPHGLLNIGPEGDVIRVGADIIRAGHPAISRYALPGIG